MLELVNAVIAFVAAVPLAYLLLSEQYAVGYPDFFQYVTGSLFALAALNVIVFVVAPDAIHFAHGVGAFLVSVALYGRVREEVEPDADFERLLR